MMDAGGLLHFMTVHEQAPTEVILVQMAICFDSSVRMHDFTDSIDEMKNVLKLKRLEWHCYTASGSWATVDFAVQALYGPTANRMGNEEARLNNQIVEIAWPQEQGGTP